MYLLSKVDQPATNAAISAAAENGHLLVVKYLHENRSEPCGADAIIRAKENGHCRIVQLLLEHEGCRLAFKKETSIRMVVYRLLCMVLLVFRFIPQTLIEFFPRIRAEEEANIRMKEEPRLRAEVEAYIREEQKTQAAIQAKKEKDMRARIRAEIQENVEDKMRTEIRAGLLGDDLKQT
ncbi:hypothetical protein L914_05542 [Phytophthora nicotianae]|uniref:Uncharacterized protein n=1 Tax=Phytophthora nicotianae TaxID=4792 RepID=W2NPG5_PHYNI|nr:hypothetical protein L914_05542 [Phytophthora nicotianae]